MEAIDMDIIVRQKTGCKDPDYFKKYYQANNKGARFSARGATNSPPRST